MKSTKKILLIAIFAAIVVAGAGIVSAGFFDSVGASDSNNAQDLNGKEVNLAAAASLKNVFDEKLWGFANSN